jgi:poly(3-hydroxybutyrate) depolymerase
MRLHARKQLRGTRFAAALLALALQAHAAAPRDATLQSGGRQRDIAVYVPRSAQNGAPVLVLLHGSGQPARSILRRWIATADQEGIVLLAPQSLDPDAWHLVADGPGLFRDAIESVAAAHPIDRQRVYLFGHSGGAVYALTLAMLESEYFAAAAVHAGSWRDRAAFNSLRYAKRKIPIAMFVGDIDEFFSVASVRRTEAALREAGHPVSVTVIKSHGHAYSRVARTLNPEMWRWLAATALESEPRFEPYQGLTRNE